MEFTILIAIAFLTMILFVVSSGKQAIDVREKREFIQLKDVVYKNQEEILLASQSLDGYLRTYQNPYNLSGKEYNLSVTGTEIIGNTRDFEFSLVIPSIGGNVNLGVNNIRKTNGAVCLNC